MVKFALYYGVLRSSGELETISLGLRGEIQNFKAQCKKDMTDAKMSSKYSGFVLATDYGLVNRYKVEKLEAPKVAKKTTKKEEK
jgi:hypothetical protein